MKSGVFKFNKLDLMDIGLEDQVDIIQDNDSWKTDDSMDNFESEQDQEEETEVIHIIESSDEGEDDPKPKRDILSDKLQNTIHSLTST